MLVIYNINFYYLRTLVVYEKLQLDRELDVSPDQLITE